MRISLGDVDEDGISMAEQMAITAKQRADAIIAELLNNWGVARRIWGGAWVLKPGGSVAFWDLFNNNFYGDIARDPRVIAAIQREVDRYEDLARQYPGAQVLPEGSSSPAGSGPQPATLAINFSTGGNVYWLKGMSPAELGERLIDLRTIEAASTAGGGTSPTSAPPAAKPVDAAVQSSLPGWLPMAAAAGFLGLIFMMGGRR